MKHNSQEKTNANKQKVNDFIKSISPDGNTFTFKNNKKSQLKNSVDTSEGSSTGTVLYTKKNKYTSKNLLLHKLSPFIKDKSINKTTSINGNNKPSLEMMTTSHSFNGVNKDITGKANYVDKDYFQAQFKQNDSLYFDYNAHKNGIAEPN